MIPSLHASLTTIGFLALATSLSRKKKAGYLAVVGTGLLLPLAVLDADPVLSLGVLVFLAARFVRRPRSGVHNPGPDAPPPSQDP